MIVLHRLGYSSDVRADNRHSARHRFEHHIGEPLAQAAEGENVHGLVKDLHIGTIAQQTETVFPSQLRDQFLEPPLMVALSDNQKLQVKTGAQEPIGSTDKEIEWLCRKRMKSLIPA